MSDYEEEWEELDPKVLLVQLLAEQQRTNQLLEQLAGGSDATEQDPTEMYRCTLCADPDQTVKREDRKRHAESQHNTPPGAWESAFEPVE